MNFLKDLIPKCKKKEVKKIKKKIVKGRHKDIAYLKRFNKKIKLVIKEGQVEIVVKNVKAVVREVK